MRITQVDFAEKINYSDKAVSKWERGESIPDVAVLKGIADFFGVTIDYMITEHSSEDKVAPTTNYEKAAHNKNHVLISAIVVVAVLVCALSVFVAIQSATPQYLHYNIIGCFLIPLPAYFILLLVFSSVWTRKRLWKIIFVSFLIWSLLLDAYCITWVATGQKAVLIFTVGIPAQIVTLMSFGIIKVKPLKHNKEESTSEISE